jgi:hypothetical protein
MIANLSGIRGIRPSAITDSVIEVDDNGMATGHPPPVVFTSIELAGAASVLPTARVATTPFFFLSAAALNLASLLCAAMSITVHLFFFFVFPFFFGLFFAARLTTIGSDFTEASFCVSMRA